MHPQLLHILIYDRLYPLLKPLQHYQTFSLMVRWCSYVHITYLYRHLLSNYRSISPLSLISCSFYMMQIQLVLPTSQLVAYPLSDPPQKHIFFLKILIQPDCFRLHLHYQECILSMWP